MVGKRNRLLTAAIATICLLAMSGCSQLFGMHDRPTPTVKPSPTATPTPTPTAIPSPTATPMRTGTPAPSPTDMPTPTATAALVSLPRSLTEVARFEVDIDGDGDEETVVVATKDVDYGRVMVGVVGTDAIVWADDQGQKGSFAYAYLAVAPNGAPCVLASVDTGSDDYVTSLYAFSNGKPVMKDELEEYVAEVSGSAVTVRDDLYVIGSWMFTCEYRITAGFKFERVSEMMIDMEYREPMHTVRPLPAEMLVGGVYTAQTLPVGSQLTPVATDAKTYMSFTLSDGREGRILFTIIEWQAYIDGVLSDEYFDNLEYWD